MRRRESLDPVVARELAAIDAALAGGGAGEHAPIAPEDAELAQLATLLVAERPPVSRAFRAAMDSRVETRFAERRPRTTAKTVRRRPLIPAFAAFAAVAVVAVVIAVNPGGAGSDRDMAVSSGSSAEIAPANPPSAADSAGSAAAPNAAAAPQSTAKGGAVDPPVDAHAGATARKVEQSSTVELGARADKVDDVAQDVLGVVGRQQGIVDESSVSTSAGAGEARFALRIPAARLQATLAELSRLPDAHVLARTDDTLDVNQAYVSVQRRLDGAEAERAGLLRALRDASSEDETDRLKARLDGVEERIAGLQRSQRALDRRVDYSRVALTVRADDSGGASGDDGGGAGFTPGSALDDAGRVLAVTAGVVVIAAAALVPLALLALCLWPLARAAQRRRREGTLDGA
ncbi:DUF4349 domain-containing protein [Conexibacter sp. CPCC 206217]|uniref:DUF4349 domain-containing protein n=1 Tax=Conexibacter sp. CPCC 206217 TaxID=3064574 RepID=UPI0027269527|nr:DUF4349 domain-containing protein [Conexibacter sp. CPCC 206217]MDO8213726.1 DUF4349 domain-containing protein [Conexibacter sp. CPCC 206217]